jgi:hypothetical protein
MSQVIDLYSLGYTAQTLNQEPKISYYQMFHGHATNYADKYYYKIELKNTSNQVIDSYTYGSQSSPITTSNAWDTVNGNFTGYGSGLRYVRVECGGKDIEYWAGNYGTIVDNSIVSVEQIINVGICSGTYSFNNQTLSASGTYTESFTGTYGCDSTVTLNLHIGPYNIHDTFNLCNGDTFHYNSQDYTSNSTITGSFTSSAGCDSNITYEVNFMPLYDDTINASLCPGESYVFGGQTLFSSGTYTDQFTSQFGCDSNVVLVLTANSANLENLVDYICLGGTYPFGGSNLTSPGNYSHTFTNASGCDSTINLTLLQDHPYDTNVSRTMCPSDTYTFGSQIITETGNYTETFFSQRGGCDSVVTLDVEMTDINLSISVLPTEMKVGESGAGVSYQWLDCSQGYNPISGANGRVFTPAQGGRYAVKITKGICKDTSACKNFTPVGVNELRTEQIRIYPVPALDVLHVVSESGLPIEKLIVRDLMGREISSLSNVSAHGQIDLTYLPTGIYSLEVRYDGKHEQQLFSKE